MKPIGVYEMQRFADCSCGALEKRLVKLAFLVVIPLLFLQIPLRHIYDFEPYPAIVLPGGAHTIRDTGL